MSLLDRIKRQKSHEKNREREMAIIAEKTQEAVEARKKGLLQITESVGNVPTSVRQEFEKQVMKEIGISRAVTQNNVRIACTQLCKIVKAKGPLDCRQQVITNLPGEIRVVLQGRTPEQAFDFYWSIPEFQTAWAMMKFTNQDLKDFISREVQK